METSCMEGPRVHRFLTSVFRLIKYFHNKIVVPFYSTFMMVYLFADGQYSQPSSI